MLDPSSFLLLFYLFLLFASILALVKSRFSFSFKSKPQTTVVPLSSQEACAFVQTVATQVLVHDQGERYRRYLQSLSERLEDNPNQPYFYRARPRETISLASKASKKAISEWTSHCKQPEQITHLVLQTCTNHDYSLKRHLVAKTSLVPTIRTLVVNDAVGQVGAFTALYLAKLIVERDPTAVALVVCVDAFALFNVTSLPLPAHLISCVGLSHFWI